MRPVPQEETRDTGRRGICRVEAIRHKVEFTVCIPLTYPSYYKIDDLYRKKKDEPSKLQMRMNRYTEKDNEIT